jgi:hypothetical protein
MWRELERPDKLTGSWRWVDVLRVGPRLEPGSGLSCVVTPPLPFRLALDVTVVEVSHCKMIEVEILGDLRGRAELTLEPEGEGTLATVSWQLEMMQRRMRAAARYMHPLLRWGHDRVVEAAVRGFRRRIQERQSP